MNKSDDLHIIQARIKNMIAIENLDISQAGLYLVNAYALFLKELHDFNQNNLSGPEYTKLRGILFINENLPRNVIKLSTPKNTESVSTHRSSCYMSDGVSLGCDGTHVESEPNK